MDLPKLKEVVSALVDIGLKPHLDESNGDWTVTVKIPDGPGVTPTQVKNFEAAHGIAGKVRYVTFN